MVRVMPIYTTAGQLAGVTSTGILLTELGQFMQTMVSGQQRQIFLVEPDGHLVATSTGEVPLNPQAREAEAEVTGQSQRLPISQSRDPVTRAVAQKLLADQTDFSQIQAPVFSALQVDGQGYFVEATPIEGGLNWVLVTVIPTAEFMETIYGNVARTTLLCALALMGSISLGLWTAEYITKPIFSLQRATQAFTDGMAVVPPTQPSRIQEVEALRQGFDHMVGQLVGSFQTLKERGRCCFSMLRVRSSWSTALPRPILGNWQKPTGSIEPAPMSYTPPKTYRWCGGCGEKPPTPTTLKWRSAIAAFPWRYTPFRCLTAWAR
jgi:sigma-B regulation protein RsbU (phosphoserine phosphatase)